MNEVETNPAGATPVANTPSSNPTPVEMWNGKLYFPKNRYILRLMTKLYKLSKKSNSPMIEFGWEICGKYAPNGDVVTTVGVKQDDGTILNVGIAGLNVSSWMMLTETAMPHAKAFHKLMGLPITDINPESPELSIYEKLVINGIVKCDKRPEMSDEIDEATGLQIPILDDAGNKIIRHQLQLNMSDIISRNIKYSPTQPW